MSHGPGVTTKWQQNQLRGLARRMVYLEACAQRAELTGDTTRAEDFWQRRETVQWQRSLLLRDLWASTPRESSLVKQ
jgi:hypothetical protein